MLAVPALHKDGRQISIEFSIQLLKGAGGQIEWVVAVLRDVTERYGREKLLRTRLKDLEAQAPKPHPTASPRCAASRVMSTDQGSRPA